MAISDTILLERWTAERDAEAFHELIQRYSGMVYATCLRMLRNAHDAEEVAQDCFVALTRHELAGGKYVGPWLHRVATNRCLDRIRSEGRRLAREDRAAESAPTETGIAWDDLQDYVDEAIAALPEKERDVILAHFLEGRTQASVAEELGVTRQAVSHRVKRGIEGIREQLRAKGVSVGGIVLGGMLAQEASAVAPATLSAGLAKVALSGAKPATATAVSTSVTAGALGAAGIVKIVAGVAVTVALIAAAVAVGVIWDRPELSADAPPVLSREYGEAKQAELKQKMAEAEAAGIAAAEQVVAERLEVASAKSSPVATVDSADFASLSGHVLTEEGEPVPGVEVMVLAFGGKQPKDRAAMVELLFGGEHTFFAMTDKDGAYRIDGIAQAGTAMATVNTPGYIVPSQMQTGGMVALEAGEHQSGYDFELQESMVALGAVVGGQGKPIPNALVFSSDTGAMLRTDKDGLFAVSLDSSPTRYTFIAYAEGHGHAHYEDLPISEEQGVTLTLKRMATVTGRLTHRDGSPAVGYTVKAYGRPGEDAHVSELVPGVGVADFDGVYAIDNLQSMYYGAEVVSPTGERVSAVTDLGFIGPGHVYHWDFENGPDMRVTGTLRQEGRGEPLANFIVAWTLNGRVQHHVRTDQHGAYTVRLLPSPGEHRLLPMKAAPNRMELLSDSRAAYGREISVVPSRQFNMDLTMPALFSASVVVLDAADRPIREGVRVDAVMEDPHGQPSKHTYTRITGDENARYVFDQFAPGVRCRFRVGADDGKQFLEMNTPSFSWQVDGGDIEQVARLLESAGVTALLVGVTPGKGGFSVEQVLENGQSRGAIGYPGMLNGDVLKIGDLLAAGHSRVILRHWTNRPERRVEWRSELLWLEPGEVTDLGDVELVRVAGDQ
jgi:RNA polymerase sigma factor (sigma-70 family)